MSKPVVDSDGCVSVRAALAAWLLDNGYDGLSNPYAECGCGLDDFMPCWDGANWNDCYAAKIVACATCAEMLVENGECNRELGSCYMAAKHGDVK